VIEVPPRSAHRLARHVDEQRIRSAITAAEAKTTGRIHVTLSHRTLGTTLAAASRAFEHLRLAHTPQRNGVLFFVVPSRREFAIVGDTGIHDKVGQEFWTRVVQEMSATMQTGSLTDGLVRGIAEAGRELETHFPVSGS
jgi:uncharacterized membrane protein